MSFPTLEISLKSKIPTTLPHGLWQKIFKFVANPLFGFIWTITPYHIFTCFFIKFHVWDIDLINVN